MTDVLPEVATGNDAQPSASLLDERYGRKRQKGLDRRLGWAIGGVAVIITAIVLLTSFWHTEPLQFDDVHYEVVDERTATLDFTVTAPPNARVACAIESLSPSYATVGWKVVELPQSEQRSRMFHETLVTTQPPTTATLHSCWLLTSAS